MLTNVWNKNSNKIDMFKMTFFPKKIDASKKLKISTQKTLTINSNLIIWRFISFKKKVNEKIIKKDVF